MKKIYLRSIITIFIVLSACNGISTAPSSPSSPSSSVLSSPEPETIFTSTAEIAIKPPAEDKPIEKIQETVIETPTTIQEQLIPTRTEHVPPSRETRSVVSVAGLEIQSWRRNVDWNLVGLTNVKWFRYNALIWSDIEPIEGERDWEKAAETENAIREASEQGLETILIIRGTPEWAQKYPGVQCGPITEDKIKSFGKFMHDVVYRYSVPPFNVKYWELWNEPDVDMKLVPQNSAFGCWGDDSDKYYGGGRYANMLKEVYPQLKNADENSKVLVGGLLLFCDPENPPVDSNNVAKDCNSSMFLEGILFNNGGGYFDGVSFHAYDYYSPLGYSNANWNSSFEDNGPVLIAKTKYLKKVLQKYGYVEKEIINSETGILCGRDGNEPICQADEFQQLKAAYAVQSNVVATAEGLRANIWYSLYGWRGTGLVDKEDNPYPVYASLKYSAEVLNNVVFGGDVDELPVGLKGYVFYSGTDEIWIVWNVLDEPVNLSLDKHPHQVRDMFGRLITDSKQEILQITKAPIYIFW